MSTKFMFANAQNAKKQILRTMTHESVFFPNGRSLHQEINQSLFSPATNLKPGQKTEVTQKLSSQRDIELDREWYIRFNMDTTDGTNLATLVSDCYTLIDQLTIEINNSKDKFVYDKLQDFRQARSMTLKRHGKDIYEYMAESQVNFNSLAGVQVTTGSVNFYYRIFDIFPQLRDQVINGLVNDVKITIRFTPEGTNAPSTGVICQSSTTSNPYSSASIVFSDVAFVRVFEIVKDPSTFIRPSLKDVIMPQYCYEAGKPFEGISWTNVGTDAQTFKLSDVAKRANIQAVNAYVRKVISAYNDASCGMQYSGVNYIKWRLRELDGDRKELSFLADTNDSTRRLRAFEIERQRRQYGVPLPLAVHADSDNLNKYYLNMTEIPFNNMEITNGTEDFFTSLDSSKNDYEITLQCSGSVGASCDLIVMVQYVKFFKWDGDKIVELPS